jgi:hypothetical protein
MSSNDSLYRDGRVMVVNRQVQPCASTFFNIGMCACAILRCACLLMHTNSERHFQRKYRWRKYRCLGFPTEMVAIVRLLCSLSSLDSSKFSNVLSRWVSEYAPWLRIGILNSILKLTEASKASPDLDPLKLRSARSPLSLSPSDSPESGMGA